LLLSVTWSISIAGDKGGVTGECVGTGKVVSIDGRELHSPTGSNKLKTIKS